MILEKKFYFNILKLTMNYYRIRIFRYFLLLFYIGCHFCSGTMAVPALSLGRW